jgi:hypothetical protein
MTLLLLAAMVACHRTPPEEALRNTISEMQAAIAAREAGTLLEHVAEDFIGPEGMGRDDARRLAQVMFLRNRDVGIHAGPLDIALQDDHATVRFSAAVTGGAGLLPDTGQVYDVETGWRLEEGEWHMVSADWKPRL